MKESNEEICSENYTEEYSEESENESLFSFSSKGYRTCVNVESILEGLSNEAVIKIEQIQQISGNIIYSLDLLWDMLLIKKLNQAFEDATENNHPYLDIFAPSAPKGSADLLIDITISNKSAYDAPVSLKRVKRCFCKPTQKKVGHINLYRTGYDLCPHRPVFQIEPISMTIKSREYKVIQFHIRYFFEGEHFLQYELSMSHGRKVNLCMRVDVLPKEGPFAVYPIASKKSFPDGSKLVSRLQPVSIADADPPLQFLWLSNGYETPVEYNIECKEGLPILNILEDSNTGLAPSYSLQPVVVLFRPQQIHEEEFLLVVRSGGKSIEWVIYGPTLSVNAPLFPAISYPNKKLLLRGGSLPTRLPVTLSSTDVALVAVCHGNQETLLHMENLSDKCIEYEWEKFFVHGVLIAHMLPAGGFLPPFKTVTLRVQIASKGPSCVGAVTLECHITVLEPPVIWDKTGWFTITEKGYSEPTPPDPPVEYQFDLSLNVRVRVLQCCDSVRGLLCCSEPICLPGPLPRQYIIQKPLPIGALLGTSESRNINPVFRLELICGFLDRVLRDVIWCPVFGRSLSLLGEEDLPLYTQIRTKYDKQERELLSVPYMSVIIQELLYKSLHDAFKLSSKYVPRPDTSGENCIISPDIYWPSESSEMASEEQEEEEEEEEYVEPQVVVSEPEKVDKKPKKEKGEKGKKGKKK